MCEEAPTKSNEERLSGLQGIADAVEVVVGGVVLRVLRTAALNLSYPSPSQSSSSSRPLLCGRSVRPCHTY